eukprot:CAMPEP_0174249110 /NCGR_PEP_ID=MMETSP0417-20130205/43415_1 /TAXON_ID=242541 /ORGANISM="Mayorella sp, Strain BSH-02190019" /LENGTH=1140 /DNA_ID=CAMNT_0015328979 /DNA_START=37 /DNA_END=3459 /DNA_ORIENTATION=+
MSSPSLQDRVRGYTKQMRELLGIEFEEQVLRQHALFSTLSLRALQSQGLVLLGLKVSRVHTGLFGKVLVSLCSRQRSLKGGSSASHTDDSAGSSLPASVFSAGDPVLFMPHGKAVDMHQRRRGSAASVSSTDLDASQWLEQSANDSEIAQGVVVRIRRDELVISFKIRPEFLNQNHFTTTFVVQQVPDTFTHRVLSQTLDALDAASTDSQSLSHPLLCELFARGSLVSETKEHASSSSSAHVASSASSLLDPHLSSSEASCSSYDSSPSSSSPPASASFSSSFTALAQGAFINPGLNQPQRNAVSLSLAQQPFCIIHGPPGTGKTTTVVETVLQLATRGDRVLVCAPSNVAVDNIVERLDQYNTGRSEKLLLVRIGHPARLLPSVLSTSLEAHVNASDSQSVLNDLRSELDVVQAVLSGSKKIPKKMQDYFARPRKELWREMRRMRGELKVRERQLVDELLTKAHVVCTTLTTAARKLVEVAGPFDVSVIDESAQAISPACFAAVLRAPRLVLAGDHLQLPPTILSDKAAEQGLSVTLMEQLTPRWPEATVMLTIQYRMHRVISDWCSKAMYGGRLVADPSVASHLLSDLPNVDADQFELTSEAMVLIDTAGYRLFDQVNEEGSKFNEGEAALTVDHLCALLKTGLAARDVGVITPYNAQVDLLRHLIEELAVGDVPELSALSQVEVGSVDGFQGREKEAIILSLVRSNEDREVGFLSEDRRTNVALTRARRHLCVIGNSNTLSSRPFLAEMVEYVQEYGLFHYPPSLTGATCDVAPVVSSSSFALDSKSPSKLESATPSSDPTEPDKSALLTEGTLPPDEASSFLQEGCTQLEVDLPRNWRVWLRALIVSFEQRSECIQIVFSPNLRPIHRKYIHEMAEDLSLEHRTDVSKNGKRTIVLSRRAPIVEEDSLVSTASSASSAALSTTACISISSISSANQAAIPSPASTSDRFPSNCSASLRSTAKVRKQAAHCHTPAKQVLTQSQAKSMKAKNKAKTKNKTSSATANTGSPKSAKNTDLDELDVAMRELKITPGVCAQERCATRVSVIFSVCAFCKLKYCLAHGLAEAHGCGAEAKKQARQSWLQQHQSPTPKPMDPNKRAYLQRRLKEEREKKSHVGQKKNSTKSTRGRGRSRGRGKK